MTIGLAMQAIGLYTTALDKATKEHAYLQDKLLAAANNKTTPPAGIRTEMARLSTLMGLYKEFIEFWKQVIKDFLAITKSVNELASGAR